MKKYFFHLLFIYLVDDNLSIKYNKNYVKLCELNDVKLVKFSV